MGEPSPNRSELVTEALIAFANIEPRPGASAEWQTLYTEATGAAWEADNLRKLVVEMLTARRAVEAADRLNLPSHEAAPVVARAEQAEARAYLATLPNGAPR